MGRKIIAVNAVLFALLATVFLLYPAGRAVLNIWDPAVGQSGTPSAAWRLYKHLTPRYATWANQRVAEGRAATLPTTDISGTEWPLFGSVFYLWAVDNLQSAWDAGDHSAGVEPKIFARDAIIAASELVIDTNHSAWVRKHWGDDYLKRENVFYRMLVMAALTEREKLLGDGAHLDMLREQVDTFAAELDASRTGLLDDYPGECYPGDVLAAVMCIKRADAVLGTNHSGTISRASRGFASITASRHPLPPYAADSKTGRPLTEARGCANAYMCLTAPEVWPALAREWFAQFDSSFWQERYTIAGFREFPTNKPAGIVRAGGGKTADGKRQPATGTRSEWLMDVDAGPVLAGFGVSASAFGLGASRMNGRFDRAYPLSAELFTVMGELPDGTLMLPRLLSNLSDAPYLGEAAILWQLSIQPQKGFSVKTGGTLPTFVYIVLIIAAVLGLWRIIESFYVIRGLKYDPEPVLRARALQIFLWFALLLGAIAAFVLHRELLGFLLLLLALCLPRKKKVRHKGAEQWSAPPANTGASPQPRP
jgi:hypothetical protein